MPDEGFVNDFKTTLSAAITTTGATSISVADPAPTGLQSKQFRIWVGPVPTPATPDPAHEIMLVTAMGASGATPWTVVRGQEDTAAITHLTGTPVVHLLTAAALLSRLVPPGFANGQLLGVVGGAPTWVTPAVADAFDIAFASSEGLVAVNVGDALDELVAAGGAGGTVGAPAHYGLIPHGTNQPATFPSGVTEMYVGGSGRNRAWVDLTDATEVRVVMCQISDAHTGAKVRAQYSTDGGSSWAYLDGASGPSVTLSNLAITETLKSGWVTLAGAANADVLVRLVTLDGNGSTIPFLGFMALQAR